MNMNRVYITGADCTGKSTFAKRLSQATGIEITKFSYVPDPAKQKKLWEAYHDIVRRTSDSVILDRGWHGAYCYHGILGTQPYDELEMLSLSKRFTSTGGTILMFTCEMKKMLERLKSRGDEFITADKMQQIQDRYCQLHLLLRKNGIPFYLIDTSSI